MFSSIKPKLDGHLFVGLDAFTNSYLILPVANPQLFCFVFQINFRFATGKKVRMGKNSEINKQSIVIFWPS